MDGSKILLHVIPPPPDFYLSRQVYWGNPYAPTDSNDDSNHSNDVPVAIDVRAATIDVCASAINIHAVVAGVSAASVDVSTAAVDLCPSDAALADLM